MAKLAALTKKKKKKKGDGKDGVDLDGSETPKSPKLGGGAGDSTKKFDAVTFKMELAALLPPRFVMRPNPEKVKAAKVRDKAKKKIRKDYATGNTDHAKERAAKIKAKAEAKAKREKKLAKMKAKIAKEKKKKGGGIARTDYNAITTAIQQKELALVKEGTGRSDSIEVLKLINTGTPARRYNRTSVDRRRHFTS